jgi:hypothetical protein
MERALSENISKIRLSVVVEAAGVEFEIRVIDNFLMARDFWC